MAKLPRDGKVRVQKLTWYVCTRLKLYAVVRSVLVVRVHCVDNWMISRCVNAVSYTSDCLLFGLRYSIVLSFSLGEHCNRALKYATTICLQILNNSRTLFRHFITFVIWTVLLNDPRTKKIRLRLSGSLALQGDFIYVSKHGLQSVPVCWAIVREREQGIVPPC
jgi:hypothetical protein